MATVQEQRVALRHVAWKTYQTLLDERRENPVPRFTYDARVLEIVSPLLPEHEEYSSNLEFLVRTLAEELSIDFRPVGSMTLQREDVEVGVEPDASFYFRNAPRVGHRRRLNLELDPPDLAIEVDMTSLSLGKFPVYARLGVPELWRYDGSRLEIRVLEGGHYVESDESRTLPGVRSDELSDRMLESQSEEIVLWQRQARSWARRIAAETGGSYADA